MYVDWISGQDLRALDALVEAPGSVPSTDWWLTTTCSFSAKGSDTLD